MGFYVIVITYIQTKVKSKNLSRDNGIVVNFLYRFTSRQPSSFLPPPASLPGILLLRNIVDIHLQSFLRNL